MEPQIIEYYNELPSYAIVINDLNDEYEELLDETQKQFSFYNNYEKKYHDLKKERNNFRLFYRPIIDIIIKEYATLLVKSKELKYK